MDIRVYIETRQESVGGQFLDAWVAYRQAKDPNYHSRIILVKEPDQADIKILFDYFFYNTNTTDLEEFDMLLACNGGEPIRVGNPRLKQFLESNDKCKLICNSRQRRPDIDRMLLWYPMDIVICKDFWLRPFYPQYHEHSTLRHLPRAPTMIYVNGRKITWREYFIRCLQNACSDIPIHDKIGSTVAKTLDSQWESEADTTFRIFCNSQYKKAPDWDTTNTYYENSVQIGFNNQFGQVPPGYFILPLYYENCCVIFPETSWQNDDLCITEKSLKCFFAGSLPFPIGGRYLNQMYEELGFRTAWHLLPDLMKKFDDIEDHFQRYDHTVKAIRWLQSNKDIFLSPAYHEYTQQNQISFSRFSGKVEVYKDFDVWFNSIVAKYHKGTVCPES